MGYCGLKIPGHTGTDFKHKKVFTESRKMLNNKSITTNAKVEQREKDPSYNWFLYLKITIAFVSICTILLLISFFVLRIDNLSIRKTHLSSEYLKSVENRENMEAAEMLYISATQYFNSGALDYAQEEITLILKLYPRNIEALQLMYKILDQQCVINDKFCEEAKDYQEYLALY